MENTENTELTSEEKEKLITEVFGVSEGDVFDDLATAMGCDEDW